MPNQLLGAMKLTYELTSEDYADFIQHATKRTEAAGKIRRSLAWLGWVYWFSAALAIIALYSFISEGDVPPSGHFYAAFAFLLVWVAAGFLYRRLFHAAFIKHGCVATGYFCQPQTLTIDESGVTVTKPMSTQTYRWAAFQGTSQSLRLYFFNLDPIQAVCVPLRLVTAELSEHVKAFIASARHDA